MKVFAGLLLIFALVGSGSALTFAEVDPSLATLDQIAGLAGITDVSALLANVTLLAPNDAAFQALLANAPPALTAAAANPNDPATQELLLSVLQGHVIPGLVYAADLEDGMEVTTAAGTTLTVGIDGDTVTFTGPTNSATVVKADLEAGDAVVHIIDTVLLPEL